MIVACIPLLGVSLALLLGGLAPWLEADQLGPVYWGAHLNGFLIFGLPNTFLIAAIIFSIAVLSRSSIASFIGALGILVAYATALTLTSDLDNERLAMLADPFALNTFNLIAKYWTVAEKNTQVLDLEGMLLLNRLIWVGVGALIWLGAYFRFSFSARRRRRKQKDAEEEVEMEAVPATLGAVPRVNLSTGTTSALKQVASQAKVDFLGIVRSVPFLVILLFGLLNMSFALSGAKDAYGLTLYPVTYNVISTIQGTMYLFTIGIIIFFSGTLIWKERDGRVDEIYDALPYPTWVPVVSKALAMAGIIIVLQLLAVLAGITAQTLKGIGFIAQIEDEEDIDMVFYVVAHEMAHQWWAHQVIGAKMQGATLLSETMSQYSALMVMEKEYGREQMQKFLRYEMDRYLRGRGSETEREKPLMEVYPNQGYIHYRKGSVAMYYLKEMIGEDNVNAALRTMIDSFAYDGSPYPTSHHLVDAFRAHTPDSLQHLVTDLFETITLFDNRMGDPVYRKLENGNYEVSFDVHAGKFRADTLGAETPVPINDWIDIGVYAEPAEGKKRGEALYWERHLITEPDPKFTIIVDELPYEAGIDPNYYLIDRIPDDNVKKVKEES